MPRGQRDTSSRSSASKRATLIFVLAEIDDSVIFRRSRSRRSRVPKGSAVVGTISLCKYGSRSRPVHVRPRVRSDDARREKLLDGIIRGETRARFAVVAPTQP